MNKSTDTITAFFYGTLRTGYWNNRRCITHRSNLIGTGKTVRRFRLFVERKIPCIVACDGGYPIVGEVWELHPEDAVWVHRLERGYDCEEIEVRLDSGKVVRAKLYYSASGRMPFYFTGKQVEVPSGDFVTAVTKAN